MLGSTTWPDFVPWPSFAPSSPSTTSSSFIAFSVCSVEEVGISFSLFSLSKSQEELKGDQMIVDCELELGNTTFSL